MGFVVYSEIDLFLAEGTDLKGKRKEVKSVMAQIDGRLGAAVAEIDNHDRWQRATLGCAVVGRDRSAAARRADTVERLVRERFPDGCAIERAELSGDEALER